MWLDGSADLVGRSRRWPSTNAKTGRWIDGSEWGGPTIRSRLVGCPEYCSSKSHDDARPFRLADADGSRTRSGRTAPTRGSRSFRSS